MDGPAANALRAALRMTNEAFAEKLEQRFGRSRSGMLSLTRSVSELQRRLTQPFTRIAEERARFAILSNAAQA